MPRSGAVPESKDPYRPAQRGAIQGVLPAQTDAEAGSLKAYVGTAAGGCPHMIPVTRQEIFSKNQARDELVIAVVVMIVIVPVLLIAPAMRIFVPPLVVFAPAVFAGFMQFVPGVLGFGAGCAMMLDRLMQVVIGVLDAMFAVVVFIRTRARYRRETEQPYAYNQ